jgi:CheY-like chemotaxis protein
VGSILFVQADPDTQMHWAAAFTGAGHEVTAVSAMRDALPVIREGGIDVLVLDVYDPRVGVVELARNLELLPEAPPIILVSGSPHAPELSARIGAAMFVPKPCEAAEVVAAAERVSGRMRPVLVVEDEPTGPNGGVARHVT